MKYARLERERRFLVRGEVPPPLEVRTIEDRYLVGARFRLRRVSGPNGVVLKLGQQEDVEPGVKRVTTTYLTQEEYDVFSSLPATSVKKSRKTILFGAARWAVDTYSDGTEIAETEDPVKTLPTWVGEEITRKIGWSGADLAARLGARSAS